MCIRVLTFALFACVLCRGQNQTEPSMPRRPVTLMDALRSTLAQNPGIQLQEQQVNVAKGILSVASGQFDTLLNAGTSQSYSEAPLTTAQQLQYELYGLQVSNIASNTTTYTLGAQKLFRNGIALEPSLTLNRLTDNVTNTEGVDQSQVLFQVVLPFLRGRGRAAVDAQELSAQSAVNASLHDTNQTVAQLLVNTAISYWDAVAAVGNLQIAKDSEARGAKYVQDVQTLIDADKVAKAEINQLIANLDGRTASRIAAEQSVITAQQSLALAMGLRADQVLVSPDASDSLPDWPDASIPKVTPDVINSFVERAMKARPDLIAAKLRRQSAEQLLPAARNQLRPQLNLTLNTGYNGLIEGTAFEKSLVAPFTGSKGLNAYGSLNFSFPPSNDIAIGQLAQANASYQESVLAETDLARTIASSVITAVTNLSTSIAGLHKAREAASYYRLALQDEQDKYSAGLTSLVNLLTIEDRLTGALSQELSARLNYGVAIENLRLATGTVVDTNLPIQTIVKETFLQPPSETELR